MSLDGINNISTFPIKMEPSLLHGREIFDALSISNYLLPYTTNPGWHNQAYIMRPKMEKEGSKKFIASAAVAAAAV